MRALQSLLFMICFDTYVTTAMATGQQSYSVTPGISTGLTTGSYTNWTDISHLGHRVQRRSLVLMCYQMDQTLGPSCLSYNGYGCYCGAGGRGQAVDDVDRCCQIHDSCYGNVGCTYYWFAYFVHYHVWCSRGHCSCYYPKWNWCAYTVCQCDREFADCLRYKSLSYYYKNYNKGKYC
ncbi:basic phospholipase A2 CM-III [Biomphalaria pfeifferi]|uniref:Phospholipase A2 n=1 Tax=Biomphalaria pfeifferi TaxID=112525 RepID=A0AAD8B5C5_BIOPF|nr:basic phospholipase A2 CM-III [Biomphalaria pfeifferi]